MPSQEEIMEFFFDMKDELENEGYCILNNIKYNFKNYKFEEELIKEKLESEMEQEHEYDEELLFD